MSSRALLIAGIAAGIVVGVALLGLALVVVALDGSTLSATTMALLILGAAVGWVLDATWLSLAIVRLMEPGRGGEDEGGNGWGGSGPRPVPPRPPDDDFDWWPQFEADLRAHLEPGDRVPAAR